MLHNFLGGLPERTIVKVGAGANGLSLQILFQNCVVVGDAIHAKRVEVLRPEARKLVQCRCDLVEALDLGFRVNDLLFVDQEGLGHELIRDVLKVKDVCEAVDCLHSLQVQPKGELGEITLNFTEKLPDH